MNPIFRQQDGALARGEPLPPLLFIGQSGLGKSLAAQTLAKRAGTTVTKFHGTESVEEIVEFLKKMKNGDVGYSDECHRQSQDVQEIWYEVIDSYNVPARYAVDSAESAPVRIAPISLIFATDQPGCLLNALHKRITTTVRFTPYPEGEMKEIVAAVASTRDILLTPQAARQLAKICNGIPRRAEQHMQRIRLHFDQTKLDNLTLDDVREYLRAYRIDASGLGEAERSLLEFLGANGRASLEALSAHLGTDADFVRDQIEPTLRHRGLITVCSSGRELTSAGKEWPRQFNARRTTTKTKRESDK